MYRPALVVTEPDGARPPSLELGLHVCTIVSSWPAAARLIDTLRAQHPDTDVTALFLTGTLGEERALGEASGCTPIGLDDLGLSAEERADLPLIYERHELLGAIVPHLLGRLLGHHPNGVLYLSDDLEVHGPLDLVGTALDAAPIVLAPAITTPEPEDDLQPSSRDLLLVGRYALGPVAVSSGADAFLAWWSRRCRWDAVHDPTNGLFGARRWLDLAATLFPVTELRHPGVVLGPLQLHDRSVRDVDLRLLGFPGFDPTQPHLIAADDDRPRHLLSDDPALASLALVRAEALASGSTPSSHDPLAVDLLVRRMAHRALRDARTDDTDLPFHVTADSWDDLARWLAEPVARPRVPVSRLLHAVWSSRTDLRMAFPDPLGDSGVALSAWAQQDSAFQQRYRPLLPPEEGGTIAPRATPELRPGFDIVGYLDAELGLGEVARILTRAVEHAGIPHRALTFRETRSRQNERFHSTGGDEPHSTTILCVNADQTPLAAARLPGTLDPSRHRVGYWFWEVDAFPTDQLQALHYVDELWVASEYVAEVFRGLTPKPVTVIPQPVAPIIRTPLERGDLELTDRFTFAFWFDAFSSVARKNPLDVVRAFVRAFRPDEGPILLIKSINGRADRRAMEALRAEAGDRPDVRLVDAYWSGIEMRSLVQLIDCYVSLHRAEGFGQTMAEAMMAGRPVIATGHSGNLQFMDAANALLVPAELVPVGTGTPYPPTARWAEPDLGEAARLMRAVVEDEGLRATVGVRAAADIERTNGLTTSAAWLRHRFLNVDANASR